MIYLNNAGTSYPKPKKVIEAIASFFSMSPEVWPTLLKMAHQDIAAFFEIPDPSQFFLTKGCTESVAFIFSHLNWKAGDVLLTTALEHHAVSRWGEKLKNDFQVEHQIIPYEQTWNLEEIERILKRRSIRLVSVCSASNVTGERIPVEAIVKLSHQHGTLCLVDLAQTAGMFPFSVQEVQPDFLVFAGHKALLGPQGVGGMYIAKETPIRVADSSIRNQDSLEKPILQDMPNYCDLGSVNMAGIVGLHAAVQWLKDNDYLEVYQKIVQFSDKIQEMLRTKPNVKLMGQHPSKTPIVSFTVEGVSPDEVERKLKEKSIMVNAGIQCAPFAHSNLGTSPEGVVRLSPGVFIKQDEIQKIIDVLEHCFK